ncbi:MAG: zinc-binding alcohol dehydrogenase [Nitrospinota bacterium]|nr:MAG: zinc-binding alcohol dehydrogenase [Nitrospinota bacterium]
MMMKGKAAVLVKPYQFEIREYPPPPVEPGGILIKVTASGICGSDLHYWRGEMKPMLSGKPGPVILGHELTGVVHTLGPGVTTDSRGLPLKEGDRVVFPYFFPCGHCYNCLRGEWNHCPHRFRFRASVEEYPYCNGGYAEYFYLYPGHFVFKVPEGLSDEALTPVNCALSQVIYALHRANLQMGDAVVIQGAGGLGLYAVAAAKERGAGLIISIDGVKGRLELARQCGADHVIDINELKEPQERIARVKELTGYRGGADVVLEVVGYPQVIPEGLDMVRKGGVYVEIGNIWPGSNVTFDMSRVLFNMTTIITTAHYDPWILSVAVDFLERTKDKYPLTRVVSHKFPLEQINEAFQQAEWLGRQQEAQVTRAILVP